MTSVKKPRPAFSCRTCRTRKVRCGREQPECANCRRMNRKCEYQSTSKGFEIQSERQAQSRTGHSTVSRIDVAPGGHSRVRQIDGSLLGLTPFPFQKKSTVDPLPPHVDFLIIASVLKAIPNKHTCDGFVQAFLTSVYPLHPLINLPRFQSWYVDFWRWCDEAGNGDSHSAIIPGILLEDVTMNCVLFAVIYTGAAASALASQESPIIKDLKTAVSTTLTACDHLNHPTVNSIAALLIIDPFMSKLLDSLEYGLWVSSVVRLAQSIGLHQQKQDTLDKDDDAETQLRRRIWTHLQWLDVQHSIVTGLPLAITVTAGGRLRFLPAPMAGAGPSDTLAEDSAILIHVRTEMARLQHRLLAVIQNASASTSVVSEEIYQGFISDARATRNARLRRSLGSQVGQVIPPARSNPHSHLLFTTPITTNIFIRSRYRGRSEPGSTLVSDNPPLHPIPPGLHVNYIVPRICATPLVLRALCGADSVHLFANIILAALARFSRCLLWSV
ncbi:hypothetical protein BDW71DRAFT_194168 [Aspergillus fruticulosus]